MTKVFFDTEFTGLRKDTTLISIALISDRAHSFYAEFTDYDQSQVDDWILKNIISSLTLIQEGIAGTKENFIVKGDKETIAKHLREWFTQFESVEMWGDFIAYDWVLFCDIFGHAFNIPKNIHYIPFDIANLFKAQGIDTDINREKYVYGSIPESIPKHISMWDAIMTKRCYDKLMQNDLDRFHGWIEKTDFYLNPIVDGDGISMVWVQEGESHQFTTKELYEIFTNSNV